MEKYAKNIGIRCDRCGSDIIKIVIDESLNVLELRCAFCDNILASFDLFDSLADITDAYDLVSIV